MLGIVWVTAVAPGQPAEPRLFQGTGHYYDLVYVATGMTWRQAKAAAEQREYLGYRGHLATIASEAENGFIASELNLQRAVWIGAFQPPDSPEPSGNWTWVTGEPWGYEFWVPWREPNNGDGGSAENFANIYGAENSEPLGSWNDYPDLPLGGYVVEFEPPVFQLAPWALAGPLPRPTMGPGVAALDNGILVFGGFDIDAQENLASTILYQPGLDPTNMASLPAARRQMGVAVAGNKVISIAGYCDGAGEMGRTVETWAYDPRRKVWDSLPALSFPRHGNGGATLGRWVYTVGGWWGDSGYSLDLVERCDPESGTGWTAVAPLRTARDSCGVAVVGDRIYVFGGHQSDPEETLASMEIYDPSSDQWTYGPSMPVAKAYFGVAVVGPRIYALGGSDGSQATSSVVYFDVHTGVWSFDRDLPEPLVHHGAAYHDGAIYIFGGATPEGDASKSTVYRALVPDAPALATQPQDIVTPFGATATLSVQATGAEPLGFRWFRNGERLSDGGQVRGAGSNVLTIAHLTPSEAGQYRVVVSNAFGCARSRWADLVVTNPPLTDGLVGSWKLDHDTRDSSPFRNHGAAHGPLTFVRHWPYGEAIDFRPANTCYIEIPHRPQYDFTNSFAVAFWIKTVADSLGPRYVIQKVFPTVDYGSTWYVMLQDSADLYFAHARNASATDYLGKLRLVRGEWNHVVFAFNARSNLFSSYLNGQLATHEVPVHPLVPLVNPLSILLMHDRHSAHYDAEGWLDEVALWNRDLSAFEVQRLFQGLTPTEELPAKFVSTPQTLDGSWQIKFVGEVGATYTLQVSSDLRDWADLRTFINFTGTLVLADETQPSADRKFFRVMRR